MRLSSLILAAAASVAFVCSSGAQTDSLQRQVAELQAQMANLRSHQARTDSLLRELSDLLGRIQGARQLAGGNESTPAATGCAAARATSNGWLAMAVIGCPVLSNDGRHIAITLDIRNASATDTIFVGAHFLCCEYSTADWLTVVDDAGQRWHSFPGAVTSLPNNLDRDILQLAPGNDFTISALLSRVNSSAIADTPPQTLSVSAALIRRTRAEQRQADMASNSMQIPSGAQVSLGIANVPVRTP
jgi:hypothetical protein